MANVCELRGGKGCTNRLNCGLRSTDPRCRGYIMAPNAPVETPPASTDQTATPTPSSTIDVNVNLPGVGIGIKI